MSKPEQDRTAFIEAAKAAVFVTAEGREIIHTFAGPFGADWDIDAVSDAIEHAQQVAFGPDIFRHHLRVITHDGRLIRFDVPLPEGKEST